MAELHADKSSVTTVPGPDSHSLFCRGPSFHTVCILAATSIP